MQISTKDALDKIKSVVDTFERMDKVLDEVYDFLGSLIAESDSNSFITECRMLRDKIEEL